MSRRIAVTRAAAVATFIAAMAAATPAATKAQSTRFLRQPDVSSTQIVFVHANDLWIVGRDGGNAVRLTSSEGAETDRRSATTGSGSHSRVSTVATPTCT